MPRHRRVISTMGTLKLYVIQLLMLFGKVVTFELIILHTNDVHDRIEETNAFGGTCSDEDSEEGKCFGGVARRMTAVENIREEGGNVMLLDAGDQFQGTLWFQYYGGNTSAFFMNELGYDVMTFGNHEFDRGTGELAIFLNIVNFTIVCSNMDASQEPLIDGMFVKHVIKEIQGQKIGIVGYLTTDMPTLVIPSGIANLKFLDEIESVRTEVEILLAQGVNKIIALGHAGFEFDKTLAESVEGIDIVIGGHTDTFLYTGTPPSNESPEGDYPIVIEQPSGDKVLVIQDYRFGKYLGFLNVSFDDEGKLTSWEGNPILLNGSIPKDPRIQQLVDDWKVPLAEIGKDVVGQTIVKMEGNREYCRAVECNLGNMMTDAMVHAVAKLQTNKSDSWAAASIAVTNGGGIRQTVLPGDVTIEDVLLIHPYGNTLQLASLKGTDIRAMLERSLHDYGEEFGGFLQVSGIKVVYDMTKKGIKRVKEVKVRCAMCTVPQFEVLDDNEYYNIIVHNFMAEGGDGYSMVRDNIVDNQKYDILLTDAMIEYFKSHVPISHGLEERIVFEEDTDTPPTTTCKASTMNAVYTVFTALVVTTFILTEFK